MSRMEIVAGALESIYPGFFLNERLAETLPEVYDHALQVYMAYGYKESEKREFAIREVTNKIWNAYSGGDTAYQAACMIVTLLEANDVQQQ